MKSNDLLEDLARLEHEQWMQWANAVKDEVNSERAKRWERYMIPYNELSEEAKDMDRDWAKKVIVCVINAYVRDEKEYGNISHEAKGVPQSEKSPEED